MDKVLETLHGVLVSPRSAFRRLAGEKPVGHAAGVLLLAAALPAVSAPPEAVQGLLEMLGIEIAPGWIVLVETGGRLGGALLSFAVMFVLSARFRGSGGFAGMFSALAFAQFPAVFRVPLDLLGRVLGDPAMTRHITAGIGVWTVILTVIALGESRDLSLGESVLIYVLSIVGLVVVGLMVLLAIVL